MTDTEQAGLPEHEIDADRLEDLRAILTIPKIRLLQQILASPTGALSAIELSARNENYGEHDSESPPQLHRPSPPYRSDVRAETDERVPNGIPRKYYAVTEYGINLLGQLGLYEQIGVLYDMYEAAELEVPNAADRPVGIADIEAYEHRPTPDWL